MSKAKLSVYSPTTGELLNLSTASSGDIGVLVAEIDDYERQLRELKRTALHELLDRRDNVRKEP